MTEEERAQRREKALEMWRDPETRAKMVAGLRKRRPVSDEARAKMRAARLGRKHSPETLAKITRKLRERAWTRAPDPGG